MAERAMRRCARWPSSLRLWLPGGHVRQALSCPRHQYAERAADVGAECVDLRHEVAHGFAHLIGLMMAQRCVQRCAAGHRTKVSAPGCLVQRRQQLVDLVIGQGLHVPVGCRAGRDAIAACLAQGRLVGGRFSSYLLLEFLHQAEAAMVAAIVAGVRRGRRGRARGDVQHVASADGHFQPDGDHAVASKRGDRAGAGVGGHCDHDLGRPLNHVVAEGAQVGRHR